MDLNIDRAIVDLRRLNSPVTLPQIEDFKQILKVRAIVIEEGGIPVGVIIDYEKFNAILQRAGGEWGPTLH